jgi:glycosyltransferase involved in cell wall biosynthesis
MHKVKVLHVTSTPEGIGGVERLLLDMAKHYDRDRFTIAHCNLFDQTGGTGPFLVGLRESGHPFFQIEGSRWNHLPQMIGKLRSLIQAEKIDVLHLHMVRATIVGGLASLMPHRAKVLVSKHYRYAMLSSALPRRLDRFVTNRADAVAAVSHSVEENVIRHGIAASKIRVVHNGIDLKSFDHRAGEGKASPSDHSPGPLLACLASLHPLKGQEYLLPAMPEIRRSFPTVRLLIVGEGAERARLEQLIQSLGIRDAVMMPGFEPNIPAMITRVDLCIHPAVDEAFGLVLLEAMAGRKAVVATNVGGVGEIVADGETGLLVPPRDPDAIARAVCSLLADAQRRERMGNAGRHRVERDFTIEKTVRFYERLYEELTLGLAP